MCCFLAHVGDKGAEELKLNNTPDLKSSSKTCQSNLLDDKSNFCINLIPGHAPVAKAPRATYTFGDARIDSATSVVDREGR